ncbi:MAG: ABC-F family ATP-binding cassette domain-containing protein [Chloroflexi bacterium]|nr:ABC-F family ATP-binding cassette domain-containing protein [Chloroflexota bacterium]
MIYAEDLTKAFGAETVLEGVTFSIGDGERVGLVGANGSGKSTLLRLIAGSETPDHGRAGHRGGALAFLRQEAAVDDARTLADEMWTAFPEAIAVQGELNSVAAALERPDADLDALIDRQGRLFERFEALDGYRIEKRVGRVLAGLGFAPSDRDRPCGEFSGGWQMRIALAKVLVHRPPHALLDEPTNHLDAAARDWLAEELLDYPGTVLVVTHDGEFLDRVAGRIIELRDAQATSYAGGYTDYQRQKAEQIHAREQAAARQERELARQQRFIERFRAKATKAAAVKSREKAVARVERVERVRGEREVSFRLESSGRTERDVLLVSRLGHAYGDGPPVLLDVNLHVERGQKVVLIGPNGGGKSTLLRILAGQIAPLEGEVEWAPRARLGYYDQHQDEALERSRTVLEEVRTAAPPETPDGELRGVLGRFLFTGDDVFKRVSVLSGGERSRVALAKFLIQPSNVLLLDEPTNHLDVTTRRKLLEALEAFDGTILCASHDPGIVDRVATRVFAVEDGECVELEDRRRD